VHVFPREIISKNSLIMHLVVGSNRFYMTDTIQGQIVCFDLVSHKSKVLKAGSKLMGPFNTPIKMPDSQTFNMVLGVLGLAIQNFSLNETLLNSTDIQNHGKRLGACDSLVSDDQQNIYMGLVDKTSIVKWNTSKSINMDENIQEMVINDPILKWINSLWIRDGYLWVAHNSFHVYTSSSINFHSNHSNFGIHRLKLTNDEKPYYKSTASKSMAGTSIHSSIITTLFCYYYSAYS